MRFNSQKKRYFCELNRNTMINRFLEQRIRDKLFKGKAILLSGPRQTGKTTLLKSIFKSEPGVRWLNGDDPETRLLLEDVSVIQWRRILGGCTILVLDEAQRISNVGLKLKLITDQMPEVQVVASGSSAFELANQINEPLTGRKWEFRLFPISYGEMEASHGFLEEHRRIAERMVYGYYPDVVNHPGEERDILSQLAESFLYKDILMWERVKKPEKLTRLLQALAFQMGSEVSYHELGQIVDLDHQTVENYINLLEQTYIIFRLPPLSRNLRKELKRKQKIYFYDNGIRNAIIAQYQPLALRQDVGALWENWLISERKKTLHYQGIHANAFFWRTQDQQEIDYVEERDGKMWAFEMKWSAKAKPAFSKTFINAYPEHVLRLIHRDNYFEWLAGE